MEGVLEVRPDSIESVVNEGREIPYVEFGDIQWFLFVDQYGTTRQGYRPFVTDDLTRGGWAPYAGPFELADDTKHGVVLPLQGSEWERLAGV